MRKMKLETEKMDVESFEVASADAPAAGTVAAHEATGVLQTCPQDTFPPRACDSNLCP